jgi:hypothetical protein
MLHDNAFLTGYEVTTAGPISQNPPSTENHLDDVFDYSSDSAVDHERSETRRVEPSEIPRVRSTHVTNGYRDGISESKARFVQEGFDEGYALGAVLGLKAGWILGVFDRLVTALGQKNLRRKVNPKTYEAPDGAMVEQWRQLEIQRGQMLRKCQELFGKAQTELVVLNLFGKDYFGEDGIWAYDVAGGEEDIVFEDVANAHPLICRWMRVVEELASAWSIDLHTLDKAASLEEAS